MALITQRVRDLTEHPKVHKHDHASRWSQNWWAREHALKYVKGKDVSRYRAIVKANGLRR